MILERILECRGMMHYYIPPAPRDVHSVMKFCFKKLILMNLLGQDLDAEEFLCGMCLRSHALQL